MLGQGFFEACVRVHITPYKSVIRFLCILIGSVLEVGHDFVHRRVGPHRKTGVTQRMSGTRHESSSTSVLMFIQGLVAVCLASLTMITLVTLTFLENVLQSRALGLTVLGIRRRRYTGACRVRLRNPGWIPVQDAGGTHGGRAVVVRHGQPHPGQESDRNGPDHGRGDNAEWQTDTDKPDETKQRGEKEVDKGHEHIRAGFVVIVQDWWDAVDGNGSTQTKAKQYTRDMDKGSGARIPLGRNHDNWLVQGHESHAPF